MKAAVFREAKKPLEIEEVQIEKPGPREVLVKTAATGVCHSDLHIANGAYPHPVPAVLGHESAGIVEEVGSQVRETPRRGRCWPPTGRIRPNGPAPPTGAEEPREQPRLM